jgi:hypothetical protein
MIDNGRDWGAPRGNDSAVKEGEVRPQRMTGHKRR